MRRRFSAVFYQPYRKPNNKPICIDSRSNHPPAIIRQRTYQPRTQALSTTRLAGGKTLVQAGHVSPRFWEITIGTYGGREGKCGVRVENNTRSVNKARQRTTMKQSIYWHVFFIKYVTRVIVRDEVVNKAWLDV